jgi:glycosyltransferase involved in cell wall biosynthesis
MPDAAPIVLFTRSLARGGAEWQLVLLARGLHERRVPVRVLTLYGGGALRPVLDAAGVPVDCLDKRGRWDMWFLVRLLRRLRDVGPRTIYAFLDVPILLTVMVRPFLAPTLVIAGVRATQLDLLQYDWLTRLTVRLAPVLLRRTDLIVANSAAGRQDLLHTGVPSRLVTVVVNGIDVTRFAPGGMARDELREGWSVSATEFLIGVVARLEPMKDHATFFAALEALRRSRPDVRAVIVGGGAPGWTQHVQELVVRHGLREVVTMIGPRDDLPAIYSACDAVCLPSAFGEGFSNVLAEAMACGLPCVATDVGDARTIVGDHGVVVAPRSPQALRDALEQLIVCRDTPEVRARRRAHIVTNFSVDRMIDDTLTAIGSAGRRAT